MKKQRYIQIRKIIYQSNTFYIFKAEDVITQENLTIKGKIHSVGINTVYKMDLTKDVSATTYKSSDTTWKIDNYMLLSSEDCEQDSVLEDCFSKMYFGNLSVGERKKILAKYPKCVSITNLLRASKGDHKVLGLGEAIYNKLLASYLSDYSHYFLFKLGMSEKNINYFYRRFNTKIYFEIAANPYLLTIYGGASLKKTEGFIDQNNLSRDPESRKDAEIVDFANSNMRQTGNMYSSITEAACSRLGFSSEADAVKDTKDRIIRLFKRKLIYYRMSEDLYSSYINYRLEEEIFITITNMLENPEVYPDIRDIDDFKDSFKDRFGFEISEDQLEAVRQLISNNILEVTGNAGSGKTTSVQAIVTYLRSVGKSYALLSTTGRAAKVLSNKVGEVVKTIHQYLGFDGLNFSKNSNNRVEHDVIIVDEMSMCDSFLANALLSSVRSKTKIVLVGDVNQLPPVGPGGFLNIIDEMKIIPKVRLKTIFRQSEGSDILRMSEKVLVDGEVTGLGDSSSFKLITHEDSSKKSSQLISILKLCEKGEMTCSVLSPVYKGEFGVENLNRMIQYYINPNFQKGKSFSNGRYVFYKGDKVLFTKNDYRKDVTICNGDIGEILSISDSKVKVNVNGDVVSLAISYSSSIMDLGYCVTVHKSQGSEYDCVCFFIDEASNFFVSKNMLYTAYTRAKKKLILFTTKAFKNTSESVLNSNESSSYRASWLRLLMKEASYDTLDKLKEKESLLENFFI